MHISSVKQDGTEVKASFSDAVILKAHPNDPKLNWGNRKSSMIEWYEFKDGNIIE